MVATVILVVARIKPLARVQHLDIGSKSKCVAKSSLRISSPCKPWHMRTEELRSSGTLTK